MDRARNGRSGVFAIPGNHEFHGDTDTGLHLFEEASLVLLKPSYT